MIIEYKRGRRVVFRIREESSKKECKSNGIGLRRQASQKEVPEKENTKRSWAH
jgi:hypothetical protein